MKKLFAFILILGCLSSTTLFKNEKNPLFELENVEQVCIISSQDFSQDGINSVVCGEKFFNYCSLSTAKRNLTNFETSMDGIQFYIGEVDLNALFESLKIEIVSSSNINNLQIFCGYTPYYQNCVFVDNKKVNVQIAVKEGQIIAGFPMILTGY